MGKVSLKSRRDGKVSISLKDHGECRVHVVNPDAEPYAAKQQRARAWRVVSLMNGLTLAQCHEILRLLEPNIQGKIGRPLGWLVDAIDLGNVEIHRGKK